MTKMLVITPAAQLAVQDLNFERLQAVLVGYARLLAFPAPFSAVLYVNEDGKGLGLRPNRLATTVCKHFNMGLADDDQITGVACISGPIDDDGNDTNCPDSVIGEIQRLTETLRFFLRVLR